VKWPPVVERWMYDDPGEHADALIRRSDRQATRAAEHERAIAVPAEKKDRYYRQARRLHVKRVMRGRG
jgi:hypothetical protein